MAADSEIAEEWKWNGPVWSRDGVICTGESYKKAVKLIFAKGASLKDPAKLFNSSLEGNVRRAIDVPKDALIDESVLRALIRAAGEFNTHNAHSCINEWDRSDLIPPTARAAANRPRHTPLVPRRESRRSGHHSSRSAPALPSYTHATS